MNEHEKALAIEIIEKVRRVLSDLPDPQIKSLDINKYDALEQTTMRLGLYLSDGQEISLYITEKFGA